MTTLYWILEYGKVFFAYMFIMFIWPNVVFRKYLKGKKPYFNFAFCSTVMILIINTLVLGLGLVHLLHQWIVFLIFYGIFFYFVFRNFTISEKKRRKIKYLFTGTYGFKTFLRDVIKFIVKTVKKWINSFKAIMYTHWWEYGIIALVVIYGMIYFTYGAFQDYSYGASDMYPHHEWIYGLVNGQIFSAGVYPEGMHCFVYAIHTFFGIRIYSVMLFVAGIHIATFLLSLYIFLRQIFRWKFTPLIAMTLFLTVDVRSVIETVGMSRLQWAIPQEFGMPAMLLCAAFLIRYLYDDRKKRKKVEKASGKNHKEKTKKEKVKLTKEEKAANKELKAKDKAELKALKVKEKENNKKFEKEKREAAKKQKEAERLALKTEREERKKNGGYAMPEGKVAYPQGENDYPEAEIVNNDAPVVYPKEEVQYEADYNKTTTETKEVSNVKVSVKETTEMAVKEEIKGNKVIYVCKSIISKIKSNFLYKILERVWKDENLFIFTLALATTLVVHFYPTIMAFFLCLAIVPLAVHKVFNPRKFMELVLAVIVGLIVAVTPMAGALLSGIQFQGSIGWAVSVMQGEDDEEITTEEPTTEEPTTPEEPTEEPTGEDSTGEDPTGETTDVISPTIDTDEGNRDDSIGGKISSLMAKAEDFIENFDVILKEKAEIVYGKAYTELYGATRAREIIISTYIAFITWAVLKVLSVFVSLIFRKKHISMTYFDGYFALILSSLFFMILYCAGSLGLPSLIAGGRVCSIGQILIVAILVVPVDAVFAGIALIIKKGIMNVVALLMVIGTYLMVYYSGNFHGYLYYMFTRYNGAVMCTEMINKTLPKDSFTIVSPVDDLYQVTDYGFHEELVEFINSSTEKSYKLPTEYVFIFVEKKPLQYAQSHFFEGPDWIAHEKYLNHFSSGASQYPDVLSTDISDEIAKLPFNKLPVSSKMYSNLETRTVLESRCYAWCQEFSKMHPNEIRVYYEDEFFVCYYFRQNPSSLFELAIQDNI